MDTSVEAPTTAKPAKLYNISLRCKNDVVMDFQFAGDINTSQFIKNMLQDVEPDDEDNSIDMSSRYETANLDPKNVNRFVKLWEFISLNSPEMYETALAPESIMYSLDVLVPLQPYLEPNEVDIQETKEHIAKIMPAGSNITAHVEYAIKALNTSISFRTMIAYLKLANFLGIEVLIKLISYKIAYYLHQYSAIKNSNTNVDETDSTK